MPISEFEQKRYEKILQDFCDSEGPPPDIHHQLKLGYRVDPQKQSVELLEIRPQFNDPSKKIEGPIAKARFIKSSNRWNVYWMRGNLKWHQYEPCPVVRTLEEFLKLVKEDAYCCFFG